MSHLSIELRPVTHSDRDFLCEVYRFTRWEELTVTGWPDAQKRAFLAQQFQFQTQDWTNNYPEARRDIILIDGASAGRLYVNRDQARHDLRVVDISLAPPFRNRGVATRLFRDLFAEADLKGWKVSIHVEHHNPAKHLYTRLGFTPAHDTGVYLRMERAALPPPSAIAANA